MTGEEEELLKSEQVIGGRRGREESEPSLSLSGLGRCHTKPMRLALRPGITCQNL